MSTTAQQRERYQLPSWITDAEIEEHGALFIACTFKSRAHLDHFIATGDMRRPDSIKAAEARKANPVKAQREKLRSRTVNIQRYVRDAEAKIAAARADLANPLPWTAYTAGETLRFQSVRLEERQRELKNATVELKLFDLMHRGDT